MKVLAPAFYAIDKRYLPMLVSILSIATNFALNWFFMFRLGLGHRGLALSTSLVAVINFVLLYIMMRQHAGRLETSLFVKTMAKVFVAGAALAGICWLALHFLFPEGHQALLTKTIDLAVTIGVGIVTFFGVAFLLQVHEVRDVVDLLRRRLGRSGQARA